MLYLAYDGTIHGDWVAHYAARLASHAPERRLHLLHIDEGAMAREELEERLDRIEHGCRRQSVSLEVAICKGERGVFHDLVERVPPGPQSYLISGVRAREKGRVYLAGTVSERLLKANLFHVLALRVVQPGLLGAPHDFLAPVAGHPRGFRSGLPFLRLLAPDIARLHLLLISRVGHDRLRRMSHEQAERLRRPGLAWCERVEQDLREALPLEEAHLDATVILATDVAREIVIHANKTKSHLICLGASERTLTQRLLHGSPIEWVLRNAPCDVAIHRGVT